MIKNTNSNDSASTIKLVYNNHDVITYSANTGSERLAVFSEIYYDKGWNAYLDGKQVPYAKVNYVLRGLMVPAGQHTVVFKFEPRSHAIGWTVTRICSILMVLLLLAAIYFEWRSRANRKPVIATTALA